MAKPAWLVKELEADDDDEEESEEEDDDEDDLAMLMNLQAAKPAAKSAPAPAPAAPAAASSKPDEDPMAALLALSGDKPAAKPAPAPTPAAPPAAAPAAATPAAKPAPAANTSMDNSSDDPLAALLTITKKPPAASTSAPATTAPPAAPGAAPPAKMPPQPSVGTLNALAQLQDLDATSSSVNDSSTNDADDLLASLGNAKPPAKATPAATNSSAPPPPAPTIAATATPSASAPPPPAATSTPPVAKASPAPPAAATPAPTPAPAAPTAASSTASDDPMASLLALSSTPTAKPAPAPTPAPAPAPAPPAPATPAAPPAAPAAKASPTPAPAPAPAPAAAPARRKMTPLERMHAAFNKADTDGSGYIEAHELAVALRSGGQDASPADVAALLARFDTDKDGRIDEDEFFEMVRMLRSGELKSTPQTATSTVQHYEVTGSAPVALTPRPGTTISVVTASYNDVNYTTQVKEEVAKKGALSAPGGAHTFLKVAAAGPTAKFVVTYLENGTPTAAPAVDNSAAARGASVPPSAPTAPAPTPVAPTQPPPAPAAAKTAPVAAATPVAPTPAAPPATAPTPAPAPTPVAPVASPAPPQPSPARPVFAAQASTPPAPLAPASSFSSEPPILQRDTPPRQAGQTGPGYATSTPPVAEVNPNRSRREPMFETNMSEIHAMSDRPAPSTPAPAPPAAQDSTVARSTQPAVEPGKFAPRVQEPLRGAAALSLSQLMVCEHPPAWYWRKPGISYLDDYIDPHAPPEPMRDRDGTLLDFSPMFEMGLGGQDVVVEVAMVQSPQKRWTRKSTKGDPSAKRLFKKRSALPAPFGEAEMVTATSTLYKARTLLEQQIDDQADQRSRAPLGGMGKVVLKEPLNPETVARLEAMPREDLRRSFFAGNKRLTLDDLWNEAPVNTTSTTTPARDDHRSFANLARKGLAYERATDAFTGLLAANNNRQGAVAGGTNAGAGLGTPARGGFGEPAVSPISGDARDVSFASGGGALGAGVPLGGATGGTLTAQERAAAAMSAMGLPRASRSPENNNTNALNTSGEVYDVTRKPFGARDPTGAPDPYSGRVPDPAVTARLSAPVSGGPNWGATNLSARSHGSSPLRDSLWGSETRGRGVFGDRREAGRDRVAGGYGPYGEAGSGTEMRPSHSLNASRGQAGLVNTVGNRTEAVGGPRSHYL